MPEEKCPFSHFPYPQTFIGNTPEKYMITYIWLFLILIINYEIIAIRGISICILKCQFLCLDILARGEVNRRRCAHYLDYSLHF